MHGTIPEELSASGMRLITMSLGIMQSFNGIQRIDIEWPDAWHKCVLKICSARKVGLTRGAMKCHECMRLRNSSPKSWRSSPTSPSTSIFFSLIAVCLAPTGILGLGRLVAGPIQVVSGLLPKTRQEKVVGSEDMFHRRKFRSQTSDNMDR